MWGILRPASDGLAITCTEAMRSGDMGGFELPSEAFEAFDVDCATRGAHRVSR